MKCNPWSRTGALEDFGRGEIDTKSKSESIDVSKLNESTLLEMIRAYGLFLIRQNPGKAVEAAVSSKLNSLFPAKSEALNIELARLLIKVEAAGIVPRVVQQLKTAPSQKEQIHYALCLKSAKKGWNAKDRTAYFEWFLKAASLQGGHSFSGFLANIRKEAIANLSQQEKEAFKELLAKTPTTKDPYAELKSRPFVKKWKLLNT